MAPENKKSLIADVSINKNHPQQTPCHPAGFWCTARHMLSTQEQMLAICKALIISLSCLYSDAKLFPSVCGSRL